MSSRISSIDGTPSGNAFRLKHPNYANFPETLTLPNKADLDAFAKVLPKNCHIIGKRGTVCIERDNSNTRHHLGRMTRRTKVVSKSEIMASDSIKLWCALTTPDIFRQYQQTLLSIFR